MIEILKNKYYKKWNNITKFEFILRFKYKMT